MAGSLLRLLDKCFQVNRHIGLLFGERLDKLFTSSDSKISGFACLHVIRFVADLFFFISGERNYFFPDSLSNSPDTCGR